MEWLTKLSNAIAYIEENLDKEISMTRQQRLPAAPLLFPACFLVAGIPCLITSENEK
ncbi:MAG: hypothetical protein ACLRMZ_02260 [Blautia marasmi]